MAPPEPHLVTPQMLPQQAQLVDDCSSLGDELHTYIMPNARAHIPYDGAISQQPSGGLFPGYRAPPAFVPSYGPTSSSPEGSINFENRSYENPAMMPNPIAQQSHKKEVDPQRFYHQPVPPEQFYNQPVPPEQFYKQKQVDLQQQYHQQVPTHQLYNQTQVDPQQFYRQQIDPQQFYHQPVPLQSVQVPLQLIQVPLQPIQVKGEPQQDQAQPQQIQFEELRLNIRHIKRIDPKKQDGMVRHLDGHVYHAANVMQRVKDGDEESKHFAERACQIRAERNNLGDCTPPRAAQARKRRRTEESMSPKGYLSGSSQGYEFGHGTRKAAENIPGQRGFASPGTHRGSYARSMTPSLRKGSTTSLSMSSGVPTPEDKTVFDVRTPENFNRPEHKRPSTAKASPSKRRKIEDVRKIIAKPLPKAAASSTSVLGSAPAAWTDETTETSATGILGPAPTEWDDKTTETSSTDVLVPAPAVWTDGTTDETTDSNFGETSFFEDSIAGMESNSP